MRIEDIKRGDIVLMAYGDETDDDGRFRSPVPPCEIGFVVKVDGHVVTFNAMPWDELDWGDFEEARTTVGKRNIRFVLGCDTDGDPLSDGLDLEDLQDLALAWEGFLVRVG